MVGNSSDPIDVREISTVKFGMDTVADKKTPASRAAHITDAAGDAVSECNAILVVLENLGFIETS